MQIELDGAGIDVEILGVNAVGHEAGNGDITDGRDLPWLQETDEQAVWEEWSVEYRDVIVVDADNLVVDVYNLTLNDLVDQGNYDTLYTMITDAAQ